LIVRSKDYMDNATPSGNNVAAEVLLRLAVLTGREDYNRKAITILRLISNLIRRYPSAFGRALAALDFYLSTPKEIAVIGESGASDTRALLREVWKRYLPNKVVAQLSEGDAHAAELVPLLRERPMVEGHATAYVCESYTCQRPVTSAEELAAQLNPRAARDASVTP
jgi:uncharacterized protein